MHHDSPKSSDQEFRSFLWSLIRISRNADVLRSFVTPLERLHRRLPADILKSLSRWSVGLSFLIFFLFIHLFIHSFFHSLSHSFIHPSVRPCLCAFVPSLIRSSTFFLSFSLFFFFLFLVCVSHSLTHSSIHPSVRPCVCSFVPSSIRRFVRSPIFLFSFCPPLFFFSYSLSVCLFFYFSSFLPFFSLLFLLYFSKRRVKKVYAGLAFF